MYSWCVHTLYIGKHNKCSLEIVDHLNIKTLITVTRTQEIHNPELQFISFAISEEGPSMAYLSQCRVNFHFGLISLGIGFLILSSICDLH